MISYLKHHQIDKARWDECISRAINRRVYAFSWYLDVVSPAWEALIADDYTRVFPLTPGKKAGLPYLFQPFFTQQLGLFSDIPIEQYTAESFMNAIPACYRYIDIQVTPGFGPVLSGLELIPRTNHELGLKDSYEGIGAGYSQNTRRNIRKAMESGVNTGRNVGTDELVRLFRENFGEKEGKLKEHHYEQMGTLIKAGMQNRQGFVRGAFDESGLLSAAAFFLADSSRIYFLFAASGPRARENGAMFFLIDQFIRENAEKPIILDFEGGNDPNLGRFYKSFGASEVLYHRLLRNSLPALLNTTLKLTRAVRKRVK
ncbi:MAG: hypothetical protein ACOYM0_02330 [Bacteroidales bacterium]